MAACALPSPRGAERSVTSAWQACTSAGLARGGRPIQPNVSSTPLVREPGELLSLTFFGSSARVDYRRRLKMNTQDSNADVLFRQEMRYPTRGAGGFSGAGLD
jgi:hypothetical protein